jgi:hypothetical protein
VPTEHLSQNEIDAATQVRIEELNTQQQMKITWPASTAVALAYVDQLTRTRGIQPERARAVKTALDRADGLRGGSDRNAAAAIEQLDALASRSTVTPALPRAATRRAHVARRTSGRAPQSSLEGER